MSHRIIYFCLIALFIIILPVILEIETMFFKDPRIPNSQVFSKSLSLGSTKLKGCGNITRTRVYYVRKHSADSFDVLYWEFTSS